MRGEESTSSAANAGSSRRLGAQLIMMVIVAAMLAVYAIPSALPFNPAKLPLRKDLQPQLWMPEGWKFFTRDPREERLYIMRRDGDHWRSAEFGPNSRAANLFGLRRRSRAQGIEAALILERLPKSHWHDCKESPLVALSQAAVTDTVVNISPSPTFCGDIGIYMQAPVPWAWAKSAMRKEVVMPSRVTRVYVKCP